MQRIRPFEHKNKAASHKHLKELEERFFSTVEEVIKKDKVGLKGSDVGRDIEEYLTAMTTDEDWKKVSDSE